jgi:hypothetical protein
LRRVVLSVSSSRSPKVLALLTRTYDARRGEKASLLMSNVEWYSVQKTSQKQKKGAAMAPLAKLSLMMLGNFDQLDLSVFTAVQHLGLAFGIAEHKDLAITEFAFLHRFFDSHGT